MTPVRARLALTALLLTFAWGVGLVIQRRVKAGDVYPQYSSFRADPFGTRALHDALGGIPEVTVERWLKPLEKIQPGPTTTWIMAGMPLKRWQRMSDDEANAIESSLQKGDRWVILLRAEERLPMPLHMRGPSPTPTPTPTPELKPGDGPVAKEVPVATRPELADWLKRWGVVPYLPEETSFEDQARVADPLFDRLPRTVPWRSEILLTIATGTEVTPWYRRAHAPVLISLQRGPGTVVFGTDAFLLSNERLADEPQPTLLTHVLGQPRRIVFVESHLGLAEDPGMAALARRYGLGPGLVLALITVALFLWRRTSSFVPPTPATERVALHYTPTTGLAGLLRRSLPPSGLVDHALRRWRETASPAARARADSQPKPGAGEHPVSHYNRIARALSLKTKP